MADGLVGLQSAINASFGPEVRRLMCYYHAKTAMKRKMANLKMSKQHKEMIIDAVRVMQLASTENEFFKICELFLQDWREYGVQTVIMLLFG